MFLEENYDTLKIKDKKIVLETLNLYDDDTVFDAQYIDISSLNPRKGREAIRYIKKCLNLYSK